MCFSGPGQESRYYTETFRDVPCIVDGFDMVLNHDFYIAVYPDRVPPMLMIRNVGKKSLKIRSGKEKRVCEDKKRVRSDRRQSVEKSFEQLRIRDKLRRHGMAIIRIIPREEIVAPLATKFKMTNGNCCCHERV
ncbi:hypothetical protein B0O99DRAFT_590556 [Bisporella sp. PMI_857]|nr:hypothetical protein B0O99DRAFT_590556 [Bisporella sp. PMI_857]